MSKNIYLHEMPAEILVNIFSFLRSDKLTQVEQVCKRFHSVIINANALWNNHPRYLSLCDRTLLSLTFSSEDKRTTFEKAKLMHEVINPKFFRFMKMAAKHSPVDKLLKCFGEPNEREINESVSRKCLRNLSHLDLTDVLLEISTLPEMFCSLLVFKPKFDAKKFESFFIKSIRAVESPIQFSVLISFCVSAGLDLSRINISEDLLRQLFMITISPCLYKRIKFSDFKKYGMNFTLENQKKYAVLFLNFIEKFFAGMKHDEGMLIDLSSCKNELTEPLLTKQIDEESLLELFQDLLDYLDLDLETIVDHPFPFVPVQYGQLLKGLTHPRLVEIVNAFIKKKTTRD